MSDNVDPRKIEELTESLDKLLETLGKTSGAGKDATTEFEAMTKKVFGVGDNTSKEMVKLFGKLGSSATDTAKGLYAGKKGAEAMAGGFDMLGDAVIALIAIINPLGAAMAFVVKKVVGAIVDYGKAAAKQGDATFKVYQDLNKVGASGSEGIKGVFDNMQKFGYGIEELDKMVKLVSENSQTLAQFGSTAASGTDAFASAMNQLTHGQTGQELMALGKTTEDINTAGAAYIKQQVSMGRTQKDIGDNLAANTKAYIKELDNLQRLTGMSAEALQKQQDEAMGEDAYNVYMEKLEGAGDAGKAQIEKIKGIMASLPEAMQKQVQKAIGGDVSAQQQLMATAPRLMKDLRDSGTTFADTASHAAEDLTKYKKSMGDSYMLNAEGMREFGGSVKDYNKAIVQLSDPEGRQKQADKDKQLGDANTKRLADIQMQERDARDSMQTFVQLGVTPATKALDTFAKAASLGARALPGTPAGARPTTSWTGGTETGSAAGKVLDIQKQLGVGAGSEKPGTPAGSQARQGVTVSGSAEARKGAERYLGKPLSDEEFSSLVKATHAESAGGKKASQQEQAMIMASILNRARDDKGGIMGALTAKNQFQSVTGTAADGHKPSQNYLTGPQGDRLKSIEGASTLLDNISKQQKNFTAADSGAYGAGTNIGYRDKMLAAGGQVIGGSVFQTAMPTGPTSGQVIGGSVSQTAMPTGPTSGYQNNLAGTDPTKALPAAQTTANATPPPAATQHAEQTNAILMGISGKLDALNRVNEHQLGVQQKQLGRT